MLTPRVSSLPFFLPTLPFFFGQRTWLGCEGEGALTPERGVVEWRRKERFFVLLGRLKGVGDQTGVRVCACVCTGLNDRSVAPSTRISLP